MRLHRHRRPRFCARFELPGTYAFNGAFVQAQAEWPKYLNIARLSIGGHHQREQHAAFEFRQPRLFTVSRGCFGNYEGRNNSRSHLKRRRLSRGSEARKECKPTGDGARIQVSVIAQAAGRPELSNTR